MVVYFTNLPFTRVTNPDRCMKEMESIIKQKRVSFSDPGRVGGSVFLGYGSGQNWVKRQMSGHVYESGDEEFAASVAAAAYAVRSLDAAKSNENTLTRGRSRSTSRSRKEHEHVMPRIRTTEIESTDTRQESTKKPGKDDGPLTGKPRKISSSSSRSTLFNSNNTDAKIDTWEKMEIEKIKKRYSKLRSRIQSWEDEKKAKAKIKLQKKKIKLECKKERNQRHYQLKIEHIEGMGRGARAKMDEKMRSEEGEVKARANRMRSVGRSCGAQYFICF